MKCKVCHGEAGDINALQKSDTIGGQPRLTTVRQLKAYRSNKLDQYGMGGLMHGQVKDLSDNEILSLAIYIEKL